MRFPLIPNVWTPHVSLLFQILLLVPLLFLRISLSIQRTIQQFGAGHILALYTGECTFCINLRKSIPIWPRKIWRAKNAVGNKFFGESVRVLGKAQVFMRCILGLKWRAVGSWNNRLQKKNSCGNRKVFPRKIVLLHWDGHWSRIFRDLLANTLVDMVGLSLAKKNSSRQLSCLKIVSRTFCVFLPNVIIRFWIIYSNKRLNIGK